MRTIKDELTQRFGTDEAIGVWFMNDETDERLTLAEYEELGKKCGHKDLSVTSYLPDNGSATQCTAYAVYARRQLGSDRVQIFGFANEENPDCDVVREDLHPCGHDFALVDGRYLLDPWVKLVVALDWQPVYDLNDPQDRALALRRYGPKERWTHMEGAEQWADEQALTEVFA